MQRISGKSHPPITLQAGAKAATIALSKYPGDQTVRLLQGILHQRSGKKTEAIRVSTIRSAASLGIHGIRELLQE